MKFSEEVTKHYLNRVQESLHFRKFYQAGYKGLNRKPPIKVVLLFNAS